MNAVMELIILAGGIVAKLRWEFQNLSRHPANSAKFMEKDPIRHFVKMLSFTEESDKENGLNGIASLVTPENRGGYHENG